MYKVVIAISLLITQSFAADLKGCLSNAGAGKLLIDRNCSCASTNSCVKFSPKATSSKMYNSTAPNGENNFSQIEKSKLKESYDLFYKIIELKASGQASSDEIKAMYIKLDKLNYDVRKSLLKNHAADYVNFKKSYSTSQETRKAKKQKFSKKIERLVQNSESNNLAKTKEANTLEGPSDEAKKPTELSASTEIKNATTSISLSRASEEEINEKNYILQNINSKKLQRNEDDSLFEIITKSYKRTAYPILLAP